MPERRILVLLIACLIWVDLIDSTKGREKLVWFVVSQSVYSKGTVNICVNMSWVPVATYYTRNVHTVLGMHTFYIYCYTRLQHSIWFRGHACIATLCRAIARIHEHEKYE